MMETAHEDMASERIHTDEEACASLGIICHDRPKTLRKALIMAGGFGTRMEELTLTMPKPMLLLQDKPILDYSIELCKRHGILDISISIFHLGARIKGYYGDGRSHGVRLTYVEEPKPMGTAGALRLHKKWLTEDFMMCNADELKDIDLGEMMKQHTETNALATVALKEVDDISLYGAVELSDKKIVSFFEKPKAAVKGFINAGLYILDPRIIGLIPKGYTMIEKDVFPWLAKNGLLFGFPFSGQWVDTGTKQKFMEAQTSWRGFKDAGGQESFPLKPRSDMLVKSDVAF